MIRTMIALLLLGGQAMAADLSPIGHINSDVNAAFALKRDSCLDNATAKVSALRQLGIEAKVLVVARKGVADTHAMVHLRLDGSTYYLDNGNNTIASAWPPLYFIVRVID